MNTSFPKRFVSIFFAFILVLSGFISARAAEAAVSKKFGTSYADAPSVPEVTEDNIYLIQKQYLLKLDKNLEETAEPKAELSANAGYGLVSPTFSDGLVFCPLNKGYVDCVDSRTMKKIWSYKDDSSGQSNTKISVSDGKVYASFWYSETDTGAFVCLDEYTGKLIFRIENVGGFYMAGPAFFGDYVIFGSDNGSYEDDAESKIYAADKNTGKISSFVTVKGDVRASVVPDFLGGKFFAVSKAGYLYSFSFSDGKICDLKERKLSGQSTCVPEIIGSYVAVGVKGENINSGKVEIFDEETLNPVKTIDVPGYPQSGFAEILKDDSAISLIFAVNSRLGNLYKIDYSGGEFSDSGLYFSAPENGFTVCPVICDDKGFVYYKNDSEYIYKIKAQPDFSGISKLIKEIFSSVGKILSLFHSLYFL